MKENEDLKFKRVVGCHCFSPPTPDPYHSRINYTVIKQTTIGKEKRDNKRIQSREK